MLICKKCKTDNPLGRVFCNGCGGKLDLKHMSNAEVTKVQEVSWFQAHGAKLFLLIPLLLIVLAVLAMIPKSGTLGEAGSRTDRRAIDRVIRSLKSPSVSGRPAEITEKGANIYAKEILAKKLKVDVLSVEIEEGYFRARIVQTLAEWKVLSYQPKIVCDVNCISKDGQFVVSKAMLGYLPLFGPCAAPVKIWLGKKLTTAKLEYLGNTSEITITEGKAKIVVKKK